MKEGALAALLLYEPARPPGRRHMRHPNVLRTTEFYALVPGKGPYNKCPIGTKISNQTPGFISHSEGDPNGIKLLISSPSDTTDIQQHFALRSCRQSDNHHHHLHHASKPTAEYALRA